MEDKKACELKELTIQRSRWGTDALKNPDGTMCCLGFAMEACGIELPPPQHKSDCRGYPREVVGAGMIPGWLLAENYGASAYTDERFSPQIPIVDIERLVRINDRDPTAVDYDKREEEIIAIFAKHGTKVTFVD